MRRRFYSKKRKSILPKILLLILVVGIVAGGYTALRYSGKLNSLKVPSNGESVSKISNVLNVQGIQQYIESLFENKQKLPVVTGESSVMLYRIGVVSDSHGSVDTFSKVVNKVVADDIDMIVHLGDVASAGQVDQLTAIKEILDKAGIPYEVLPGDHDYNWTPTYSLDNYASVFGRSNAESRIITQHGFVFVLLNNSSQEGSHQNDVAWLENNLSQAISPSTRNVFAFTARPLYNPYFPDKQDELGTEVLLTLRKYPVREIFSGDTHVFARYTDQVTEIPITTVGASGDYKNPLPQYVLIDLYENGEYTLVAKPGIETESLD